MDKLNKMTKVAYSLSAGVLASTLALSAFNHQVHAEEALNKAEILEKLEELEEHVYTIAEADHEDASANFSENEEMKAVKKLLVEALTKAIGEDFKKLIDVEKTSVEVFEQLFNLVTSLLEEEYPVAIDFEKMTILSHEDNNEEKLTIDTDAQKLLNDNELKEHVAIDANLKDQSVEIESVENTQESVTEVSHNDHVEEVDEVVEESTVTHVDSSNETTSKEEVVVDESHDENIKEIDHKEEITQKDTKSEQKAAPEVKKEVKTVAAAKSASPLMVARTSSRASTYVVQPGDTLNAISRKFDVSVGTLAKLNNIQNINIIYVGQVLRLNGSVTPSNSSTIQITTRDQFISTVGEHARQVANKNGLYASVMVAQAALESGFGQSTLSKAPNYNLFGIKGNYNGQSVTMKTSEWSSSNGWYQVNADFRKYPSYAESLQDNANVLRNGPSWDPNYYKGAWRENANSYLDATQWLQGRYATDPSYASKLNNIISMYNLTRFDTISENTSHTQTSDQVSKPSTKPAPQAKPSPSAPSTSSNTYTVVSGDTLSQIAQKFGTTVAAIA
ncbi:glucosaminidase domain-containing protein, partial [Allofustis seminis]|uniref:glucosaminidase domain-containing protein n=1 Tax=Allofustis seminis TaxID=166939 RepID=UPI0003670455